MVLSLMRESNYPIIQLTRTVLPDLSQSADGSTTASNSPSNSSVIQPLISSSVGVHFAGRELGGISVLTGIPFLLPEGQEWIQARTGQTIASHKLSPTRAPWEKERGQATTNFLIDLQSHDAFELPDLRITRLHLDAYKNSRAMLRIFPVVDPELFEETVRLAYQQSPNNFQFGQASTRACILAFVAFTTRLPPVQSQVKASTATSVDHDAMVTRAQFLLSQMLQEPASLEGAQAVTMLVSFASKNIILSLNRLAYTVDSV